MVTRRDRGRARELLRERLADRGDALRKAWEHSVPSSYTGYTLEELLESDRLVKGTPSRVLRFIDRPDRFALLTGPTGVGKTTLAVSMVGRMVEDRLAHAEFRSFLRLMQDFSFRPEGTDPLREAVAAPILLLDDLGSRNEGLTPHQERTLWSLLDSRWADPDKITVLTTNMSLRAQRGEGIGLAEWMGESAWDRVTDSLTLVKFEGETLRGQ